MLTIDLQSYYAVDLFRFFQGELAVDIPSGSVYERSGCERIQVLSSCRIFHVDGNRSFGCVIQG